MSRNGKRIVSAAYDHTIRVWDAEKGVMIGQPLEVEWIDRFAASAEGTEVVTASSYMICVFNIEHMDTSDRPERYTGSVECVAYCGRGTRVVTVSGDGCVRVWDAEHGERIGQPLADHECEVTCAAVSADGNRIVSGSRDGTVLVWNVNSGEAVAEPFSSVEGREITPIESVAVNNDGTRVVFSFRQQVWVRDVESGEAMSATRDAERDTCVAMSADGAQIAFLSPRWEVTVWDVKRRQVLRSFRRGQTDSIRSIAFGGDAKRVVSGSDHGTVCVWDVASGKAVGDPFVHDCGVVHVESDVDGSMVASYDERGYGRLWDVTRGQCVMTSTDAGWTPTLHRFDVAAINWRFPRAAIRRIMGRNGAGHEQLLATTDREMVRVGDVCFSRVHGCAFWPRSRVVR